MAFETTVEVVMPAMGDSVSEGTVLEWRKQEGDQVSEDETLVEILARYDAVARETEAAIATALHFYLSDAVHDIEPGFITLRRNPSDWDAKQLNFRKSPRK